MCDGKCKCGCGKSSESKIVMPLGNVACVIVTAIIKPDCTVEVDGEVFKEFPKELWFSDCDQKAHISAVTFNGQVLGDKAVCWDANHPEVSPALVADYIHSLCKEAVCDFTQEEGYELMLEYAS